MMGKFSLGWIGVVIYIICLPITHAFSYNGFINLSTISVGILIILNLHKIKLPLRIEHKTLYICLLLSSIPLFFNRPDYIKSIVHYFAFLGSVLFFYVVPAVIISKYSLNSLEGVVRKSIYLSVTLALVELLSMIFFRYQLNLPRPDVLYYDPPLFMMDDYRVVRVRGWSVESGHFATSILFLSLPFLFNNKYRSKLISFLVLVNILITNGMTAFGIYFIKLTTVLIKKFHRIRNFRKVLFLLFIAYPIYYAIDKIFDKAIDSSSSDRINRIKLAWSYVEDNIVSLLFGVGPGMLDEVGVNGSVVSFFGVVFFEYGIIVFILIIIFLTILLINNKSNVKKFYIIAFILNAVFISNFWYPFFWYPLILLTIYREKIEKSSFYNKINGR